MKYHALFVIFEKKSNIWNCCLLQIIGGSLLRSNKGGVKTPAWKARVLATPRGLADVSVSENHVWLLLLPKVIFHMKTLGKRFEKFILVLL